VCALSLCSAVCLFVCVNVFVLARDMCLCVRVCARFGNPENMAGKLGFSGFSYCLSVYTNNLLTQSSWDVCPMRRSQSPSLNTSLYAKID